jgi:hypothetical protein
MLSIRSTLSTAALVATVISVSTANAQATGLGRLAWLGGCWEQRAANRVTMEMWMPAAGDLMIGGSRTVVANVAREFEHLRIRARGDTLIYTAIPSGQKETDFRSVQVTATSVTFENKAHDFPQRIIYRRGGADSVIARVEGPGPNNTTRGFDVPMRRASCGG